MRYLRQSTSVDVGVGPFLDETDGKTAETALTITQPDVRLKKNAGAWAQKAAAQTLTHEEAGWYEVTLDATDTDTIGILLVAIHESGALPVWVEFEVLDEAVYDVLFGTTALSTLGGTAQTGDSYALANGANGFVALKSDTAAILVDTGTTLDVRIPAALVGGRMDSSVGAMAANVITAAAAAADFGTEIGVAVWAETTRTLTGTQTFNNTGTWTGNIVGTLSTLTTYTGNTVQTGDSFGRLGAPAGASVSADIAAAKANLVSIIAAIGAFTATGVNTILGMFQALMRSDATTPSDVGGTFDDATDSLQAIRDRGDAAWVTGGASSVVQFIGCWTKSGSTYFASFVVTAAGAIVAGASLSSLTIEFYDEDGTALTFSGSLTAAAGGICYASGTLGTAITSNRPVFVRVGATYSAVAYSSALPGAQTS